MEKVNGICRLCLENGANIFIYSDNSTIHEKLLSYCKLKIFKNDGLPEKVCGFCLKQLDVVVDFINKCEESDKILRNEYNPKREEILIKDEPPNPAYETSFDCNEYDDGHCTPSYDDDNIRIKDEASYDKNNQTANYFDLPDSNSDFNHVDIKPKHKLHKKNNVNRKKKCKSSSNPKIQDIIENCLQENNSEKKNDLKKELLKSDIKLEGSEDINFSNENKSAINKVSRKRKRGVSSKINTGKTDDNKKSSRKRKFEDESSLCPICGKCFPYARTLRLHLQKHSGIMHKCSKCPKTFITREFMKVHELRHACVKNFPCEVCGSTFASNYLSRKHFQLVHQRLKAVACKLCDKVLCNSRGLAEHMKIHTGEKRYECQLCQKKFTHKLSLTCHIRVHTGEQPYACQYCEKRFSILKSLKEHERLHTGEKPYMCPLCPKRFEQLSNMKSHFRYNHKGLDLKQAQELKANEQIIVSVNPASTNNTLTNLIPQVLEEKNRYPVIL